VTPKQFLNLCKWASRDVLVDKGFTNAAAIAYYAIISMFPLLLLLIGIVGFLLKDESAERIVDLAWLYLPPRSLELIRENIHSIIQSRDSLSVLSAIGLLWSASLMFDAINEAVNTAWGVRAPERYFLSKLKSMLMMTVLLCVALASVLLATHGALFARLGALLLRISPWEWVWSIGHAVWSVLGRLASLTLTIGVLGVLYLYLPRLRVGWKDVLLGAVCAGVCWEVSKHAFIWYVTRVTDYTKVYGSIAAVLVLLIWVHLSALIVIWGAELSSEYSRFRKACRAEGVPHNATHSL
jgi:membrane protein